MRETAFLPCLVLFATVTFGQNQETTVLDRVLDEAGSNRVELENALREAGPRRAAMQHLIAGMPSSDARTLRAERLLETLRLADLARAEAKWGRSVDDRLFLDHVLPYANVDEPRDPWRKDFRKRFWKLVQDCETPGEAAKTLNAKVFPALGVKYSTKRKRANQSPAESIEQGLASCTGLSIILVNACRACGIPARLAGVKNWRKKRGNHTWVEVWSDGWHHVGAAEPNELDRVWFAGDVAHAVSGSEDYGVWATTWSRTPHRFPMAWSTGRSEVFAVETTSRYLPKVPTTDDAQSVRVSMRVRLESGERIAVPVRVVCNEKDVTFEGMSRDESADTNDILAFKLTRQSTWTIYVGKGPLTEERTWRADKRDDVILDFVIDQK